MSPRRLNTQKVLPRDSTIGSVSPECGPCATDGDAASAPPGGPPSSASRDDAFDSLLGRDRAPVHLEVPLDHAGAPELLDGTHATAGAIEAHFAGRQRAQPRRHLL